MAKRPTLTDLTSLTNSSAINTLSQNWDAIEEAFDNTLSLDGSTPNAMNADFDLNGNGLLNVGTIDVENLTLNGQIVTDLATVPEWRSAWVTATSYAKNDLVKTNGNVYICLVAHTSGTFATDLTTLKWELMVSKGDSGSGTGDLVSTNNLSDIANPATSRSNLGLGTVATESTVPVAKGGTGATDAATARSNLGVQAAGATLSSLSGLTLAQGDLLYASGPGTLVMLPKGAAGQVLAMNSGATAPEWINGEFIQTLASAHAGSNVTTAQNLFPLNVTLDANSIYQYELVFSQVKSAGATSHQIRYGWDGTASIAAMQRNFYMSWDAGGAASSLAWTGAYATAGEQTFTNNIANASVVTWMQERGSIVTTTGGTIIPQYRLTAAPGGAYSTRAGSYFRLRKLGASGGNIAIGPWA